MARLIMLNNNFNFALFLMLAGYKLKYSDDELMSEKPAMLKVSVFLPGMPGEPAGISGKAMPARFGLSANNFSIASIGICPSTV